MCNLTFKMSTESHLTCFLDFNVALHFVEPECVDLSALVASAEKRVSQKNELGQFYRLVSSYSQHVRK